MRSGIKTRWFEENEVMHPIHIAWEWEGEEDFSGRNLKNWHSFVSDNPCREGVTILESSLSTWTIGFLFVHNVKRKCIEAHFRGIWENIEVLDPVLIHLHQEDIARHIAQIAERRDKDWLEWFIDFTSSLPFARQRKLEGFEGTVSFWQVYSELIDHLFSHFGGNKLALETSAGDWEDYHKRVLH